MIGSISSCVWITAYIRKSFEFVDSSALTEKKLEFSDKFVYEGWPIILLVDRLTNLDKLKTDTTSPMYNFMCSFRTTFHKSYKSTHRYTLINFLRTFHSHDIHQIDMAAAFCYQSSILMVKWPKHTGEFCYKQTAYRVDVKFEGFCLFIECIVRWNTLILIHTYICIHRERCR